MGWHHGAFVCLDLAMAQVPLVTLRMPVSWVCQTATSRPPADTKEKKLAAEIANGRLAMMAIIGSLGARFQNVSRVEIHNFSALNQRFWSFSP